METFFLFHSNESSDLCVWTFKTKEELARHIKESNDDSIRADCRPIYLPATAANFEKVKNGDREAIIIKGFSVIPKAVTVVREFEIE